MKVVVIGGGWSGCAAAITAKKAGAEVHIYEKTDLLLGLGNVGGIMRNNGRYTAAEELIALGGGDLINLTDVYCTHKNIDFPGHKHATLYDVNIIEGRVREYILSLDINLHLEKRVRDVEMEDHKIKNVIIMIALAVTACVFKTDQYIYPSLLFPVFLFLSFCSSRHRYTHAIEKNSLTVGRSRSGYPAISFRKSRLPLSQQLITHVRIARSTLGQLI